MAYQSPNKAVKKPVLLSKIWQKKGYPQALIDLQQVHETLQDQITALKRKVAQLNSQALYQHYIDLIREDLDIVVQINQHLCVLLDKRVK